MAKKKQEVDLFEHAPENRKTRLGRQVVQNIIDLDLDRMTPFDALCQLNEWKKYFVDK
jgi:hypothetical protein